MSYSRKRTPSQSGSNYSNNNNGGGQRNKPRFGGGHGHNNNNNRPRKNYGAMREKYLSQARDALASGDRVLAENYFQHADHCFRMLAEENANRPQRHHSHHERTEPAEQAENVEATVEADETVPSVLPAFLTATAPKKEGEPVIVPNWEEE